MDKLKMHSPDVSQQNVARIRKLFPGCVTEAMGQDGRVLLAVDFDHLRQELSNTIVDGPRERYHLNWPGKKESLLISNAPIAKTLRPSRDESVDFLTTKNIFVEGDNLDALKILQDSYLEKVKIIYIDPPYNTGNDFIYDDDFSEESEGFLLRSNQTDESGNRLVANTETNARFHSDWLSMMFARLRLARNLLRNDGVIFISIDDGENAALKIVCDEIFGSANFISNAVRVAKRTSDKGTHFRPTKDYILAYAKSIEALPEFGIRKTVDENDYKLTEKDGRKYKKSGASLYQPSLDARPNQRYYIEAPDGTLIIPPGTIFPSEKRDGSKIKPVSNADKVWRWSVDSYMKQKDLLIFTKGSDQNPLLDEHGNQSKWNIYPKVYLEDDLISSLHPEDIIYDYPNSQGTKEIKSLGIPFSFAKPVDLIAYLLKLTGSDDALVVDFFSGSSTAAHAVMQLNAEDGGTRQFIMVQLPEVFDDKSEAHNYGYKNIAELSKERIRRSGKKIIEGNCHENWSRDIGFRVLKIDSSNMAEVHYAPDNTTQKQTLLFTSHIKPDRTPEDLLFQVLLDWGVDITLPIATETIAGKQVFFVDSNALAACFELNITEALITELAKRQPLRAVFRDDGFKDDATKINAEQIFKQLSPNTDVKVI